MLSEINIDHDNKTNQSVKSTNGIAMKNLFLITKMGAATSIFVVSISAQAVTINSAPIPISLAVASPTCTVKNTAAAITLPAASVGQTVGSYQALYLTTPPVATPNSTDNFTSTALNQTVVISCDTANTTISSFVIQPGPGAFTGSPTPVSIQYLVDASVPPVKAGGGAGNHMIVQAEQISINGTPANVTYSAAGSYTLTPYTTTFTTGALTGSPATSVANVVWRPLFYTGVNSQNKFTAPVGGSYNGSFQIVVIY